MATRIWYVVSALDVGGPHPLIELANGMADRGFDVTVWSLLDELALADEFDSSVTVRTVGATSKTEVWKLTGLVREARAERPEIVHSYFFFDNMVNRLLEILCPGTTTACGIMSVRRNQSWHRRVVEDSLLWVPDYYVSNSRAGKEFVVDRGVPAERIEVIYNGRSADVYGDHVDASHLYDELSLPRNAYLVGNVARLIETKGHEDLLRAVARLRDEGRDVHGLLVGDGPRRDALEATAAELGCREHVTFAGERTDVPALLNAMDAFVFPTYQEGLPGAVIEAMLTGLPIVSTPIDGCAELLTDGETGLFVPVGDSDAVAAVIRRLADDPDLAAELGQNAREKAASSFSTERRLEAFEQFYRRIANEG